MGSMASWQLHTPGRLLALTWLCLIGAAPVRAEVVDKIVATVDGEPITLHEVKAFSQGIRGRQISAQMGQSGLLEALITDKLIQREVSEKGIVVRDEDVDRYIAAIMQRNNIDEDKLREALAAQGLDFQGYRAQIREEIERDQLVSKEIRGKVSVTPEEVQRYYDSHLSEFSTPEKLQLAHILFRLEADAPSDKVSATTAKADDVYRRLKKGADFAEMAKQFSEDSAERGGELGWFKKGEMLEPIEKAAQKLKVGEISQPVRSKVGLHIIKLEGREGATHQKLDELSDQIKQQLYNAALEERFQKWMTEDLRKRHHVEMIE